MRRGLLLGGFMIALAGAGARGGLPADDPWLRGYQRSLSGETISYHSPYPDTTQALLTRATDGRMAIEWETEPVPADFDQSFATFVWMFGMGHAGHAVSLLVDGAPLLTFHTRGGPALGTWEVPGADGASLRFRATMADQFDELFGFAWLTLPRSRVNPGQTVRLRAVGENAGSPDWFMVFEDSLAPSVTVAAEEALVRRAGRLDQLVRVEVSHIAPPCGIAISIGDGETLRDTLRVGYNALQVPVGAVAAEEARRVRIEIEGRPALEETVRLRPVTRRELWLLPHSHTDIGYSDRQEVVERKHWRYLEDAIDLARRTAGYPPGAQFKWNVEVLWPLETYLAQASPARRAAVIDAVRRGWVGLEALPANVLTGLCHPEEQFRLFDLAHRLERECGTAIRSAMITDIPSYTWSLVPAMAQSGVAYLSSGPNYMPTLADGGDRIGHAMKAWADKPCYWISPSGEEKVLLWMAGRGYSWFHGLHMGPLRLGKQHAILEYVRRLAAAGYPYSMVQVRYTIGGDNGPPDPELPEIVKAWNERYESPRLVIATTPEMFEAFERRHGSAIPEVRGDFTPYWEDGAASTARETAMNRVTAERLVQGEALWAMLAPEAYPAEAFREAWRQVILFDEHTWGAAESVSDPDGENSRAQWAWKEALALDARRRADALIDSLRERRGGARGASAVDVANTSSWTRTDVVLVPEALSGAGDRVCDDAGRRVPSQRLTTGELAVLVEGVPPFASRRYSISAGAKEDPPGGTARADAAAGRLENERLAVSIDPMTGAIASLRWKAESGGPGDVREIEFVDRGRHSGLNEYLYVPGRDPKEAQGVRGARIAVKERGPLVASLIVESDAPGCVRLSREIRLSAGLGRVEIRDLLDRQRVPEKESVHVAFPFRVPNGEVRLDLGWAFIRPDDDQIAGACRDFFCIHNTADVSNQDLGVTLVTLDAPMVEVGEMTDESPVARGRRAWRTEIAPTQAIYSYAMNNYWHTNYKADQDGPAELRYLLRPHGAFSAAETKRFGIECGRPLLVLPAGAEPGAPTLLAVEPSDVLATSLRPTDDGAGWIVRLQNVSGEGRTVRVGGEIGRAGSIHRCDPFGEGQVALVGPFEMLPDEIATLRIQRGR
jgi:hypothetical protein